jgi:Taurine catabolism dioxygenase TauD, TfdA family
MGQETRERNLSGRTGPNKSVAPGTTGDQRATASVAAIALVMGIIRAPISPDGIAVGVLVAFLAAHSVEDRFIYYHRWRVGDVLMWDERAMMHRGAGDYQTPLLNVTPSSRGEMPGGRRRVVNRALRFVGCDRLAGLASEGARPGSHVS